MRWANRVCIACSFSRRSTERHHTNVSLPSGPAQSLASTPARTLCQSWASAIARAHLRSSLLAACQAVTASGLPEPLKVLGAGHAAIHHPDALGQPVALFHLLDDLFHSTATSTAFNASAKNCRARS